MTEIFKIGYSILLELIPEMAIEHLRINPNQEQKDRINKDLYEIMKVLK